MNNRRVTIRTNIWRACFLALVFWLLLFHSDWVSTTSLDRLTPDISRFDDLYSLVAYAMLGIVVVAIVKLITQSR